MSNEKKNNESFVSASLFVGALAIIGCLMVAGYIATVLIPCDGIPLWRFLLSPLLVLTADGNVSLIGVLIFLLLIGGVFNCLQRAGVMNYLLGTIADRFGGKRYRLMAMIILFFMAMGSLVGCFEECVPMVPIVVALALELGWDRLTGVAMSMLAVGCGFAAGVFNPFTVGLAQEMAELPMFSGAAFRLLDFVCIYGLLLLFTRSHAKKVDRGVQTAGREAFVKNPQMARAVKLFAAILCLGILAVLSSSVLTVLRDYTFIIIGLAFFFAGLVSCHISGMRGRDFWHFFGKGVLSMLPAVVMILMASSIKYTLEYAGLLTVIIDSAIAAMETLPAWAVVLFIYLLVLVMNFFIASGSAKAIMLIPLLVPVADHFGISRQLLVIAYAFGDGFSNVMYPTNPALLVAIGLADVKYADWFKWSVRFQAMNLLLTSLLLLLGHALGI